MDWTACLFTAYAAMASYGVWHEKHRTSARLLAILACGISIYLWLPTLGLMLAVLLLAGAILCAWLVFVGLASYLSQAHGHRHA